MPPHPEQGTGSEGLRAGGRSGEEGLPGETAAGRRVRFGSVIRTWSTARGLEGQCEPASLALGPASVLGGQGQQL